MSNDILTGAYSEMIDGPVYSTIEETSPYVVGIVAAIPSAHDMVNEFRRALVELSPGTECLPLKKSDRFRRRSLHQRVRLDHELVVQLSDATGRGSDIIRREFLRAARVLAERIATELPSDRQMTVRWTNGQMMVNLVGDNGHRRICLDMRSDAWLAILSSYYVICPPGEEVVSP